MAVELHNELPIATWNNTISAEMEKFISIHYVAALPY